MSSPWHRLSNDGLLDERARKALRRGDVDEATRWYRALALRQGAEERAHLASERRWKFNNASKKLKRMQEELDRANQIMAWNPNEFAAGKAAIKAQEAAAASEGKARRD